jgi:uncharacterized protein (TIGR00661 family)
MRIVYGVAGMGMGHSIRSKPTIDYLLKKHDVLIACGGSSYGFFSKKYKTLEVPSLRIKFINGHTSNLYTFFYNLIKLPVYLYNACKIYYSIAKFKPDIFISDFEPFTNYLSKIYGKKLIAIDNMNVIVRTKMKNHGKYLDYLSTKIIVRLFSPFAQKYFITSFFDSPVKTKKAKIIPPILRKEIINARAKYSDYYVVYLATLNERIIDCLRKVNAKFIIYGLDKKLRQKNLIFRKFSEKMFIKEISNCKALICNGGFTTISEALYLKKPILSIPIGKQYEQYLNAYYLDRLGYGLMAEELDIKTFNSFQKNWASYAEKLKSYRGVGNMALFKELDNIISSIRI